MASQHDYFRGFVGTGDLGDGIVGSFAFGVEAIGDFKIERDVFAIGEEAFDAAEVVIAEDDSGDGGSGVVAAVLLGDDDAVGAGGVVNPDECATGDEHGVYLGSGLVEGVAGWVAGRWRGSTAHVASAAWG